VPVWRATRTPQRADEDISLDLESKAYTCPGARARSRSARSTRSTISASRTGQREQVHGLPCRLWLGGRQGEANRPIPRMSIAWPAMPTRKLRQGLYGNPSPSVNLLAAARSVRATTRENCGKCHFDGGGGNGVKHGDLDESLYFPGRSLDVHMAAGTTCSAVTAMSPASTRFSAAHRRQLHDRSCRAGVLRTMPPRQDHKDERIASH